MLIGAICSANAVWNDQQLVRQSLHVPISFMLNATLSTKGCLSHRVADIARGSIQVIACLKTALLQRHIHTVHIEMTLPNLGESATKTKPSVRGTIANCR